MSAVGVGLVAQEDNKRPTTAQPAGLMPSQRSRAITGYGIDRSGHIRPRDSAPTHATAAALGAHVDPHDTAAHHKQWLMESGSKARSNSLEADSPIKLSERQGARVHHQDNEQNDANHGGNQAADQPPRPRRDRSFSNRSLVCARL
jgi:hypothetical protein